MLVLLVALAPAAALAIYFYHKDKYEPEPLGLLSKAFFAGFAVTFLIIIVEIIVMAALVLPVQCFFLKIFLMSFFVAGLIEEGFKFLVFRRMIYNNKEFNEPYDGIIYAVMISLGFAAMENIMYVMAGAFKWGVLGTFQVGITRAMFSVPTHAFCATIMGYYLGLAKFCGDRERERENIYKGLGFAILAHGLYDFFLFTKTAAGVLFMLILFIFCWNFALRAIKIQEEKSPFKER